MDLDFDDQLSDHVAPTAKAGARFKPKGRPQPKKKQVSLPNSQTTISTDVAKETLSTQIVSTSETIVSDNGTIDHSNIETISKENVDEFAGEVNCYTKPSILRVCTNADVERKRCDDDGIEPALEFPDDPRTQESTTFGDFVTPETDEVTHAQTQRMQTEEEECQLDMETLDIVHEECITSAYEQHTGKFQPKPRLLDTVIEEPESHNSVDDTGYFTNEPEYMVDVEARNDFSTNSTFSELQEEDLHSPEVHRETAPEMETQNASDEREHEVLPSTNNTVIGDVENCLEDAVEEEQSGGKGKKGKSKKTTGRRRKTTSDNDPNESSENPQQQKKFKHSTRRQKRTLEKELLETPDHEIRYLPIRDMLRLVEYKEWLEKKEAKGAAAVVPPAQESNTNTSGNQYHSQGFDAEDEFGIEEGENQETSVVKPDSPVNYQTYMKKTPRTRWSKQDTELFYEGIQEFGSNLSMVQQLFPDRTREQIKLKFKSEERRYPLKLNDALSSRSKHLTHFQNVIKKLQQEAAAAKEGEEGEEEEEEGEEAAEAETETTTDVPEKEEPTAKSEETERAGDEVAGGGDESDNDGGDNDDDDFWNSYKSDM